MRKKKLLLIADDEKTLHHYYQELFGEEFEVLHAYDGAEALMLAVEHVPDVMILDVAMPLLGGAEAYEEIRKTNPDIRALFMSGYAADTLPAGTLSDERVAFIPKPVSQKKLLRAIREALA